MKKRILIPLFLALCLCFGLAASAETDWDAKLSSLEKELADIQNKKADLEAETKQLKSEQKDLNKQKQSVEQEIDMLTAEIQVQNNLIDSLNGRITATTAQLEQAQQTYDTYYEEYKARIRANYEAGNLTYLEILLGAQNMSDFLTRVDYVTQITAYDNMIMEKMHTSIQTIEAAKASIEADLASSQTVAADLEHNKNLQKAKATEVDHLLDDIKDDISANNAALEEFERLEEEANKEIYLIQQERARRLETSEDFMWPLPLKYGRKSITSYYLEYRNFDKQPHRALDIAAPKGTEIYASNAGEIIMYKYVNTGGGRKVVIDHGSGISTQYCHMSAFVEGMKVGDYVERGQVIGYVGKSGTATGNHIHFVVTIDGKAVNPLLYITPDDTAEKSLLDEVK